MARNTDSPPNFGELDGKPIERALIKIRGASAQIDRRLETGDRLILVVEAYVGEGVTVIEDAGKLTKIHPAAIVAVAPSDPAEDRTVIEWYGSYVDRTTGEVRLDLYPADE